MSLSQEKGFGICCAFLFFNQNPSTQFLLIPSSQHPLLFYRNA
jgi:hypothetical protein